MTHRDFVFWLQGHMEINNPLTIDKSALEIIKEHIRIVLEYEKKNKDQVYAGSTYGGGITSFATPFNGTYTAVC